MIEILTTGGTIDKVYFDALSEFQIGDPAVEFVLGQAGVETEHTLRRLMSKDSLELTDDDRATIRGAVEQSAARRILITHGTDTMAKTAAAIDRAATSAGKTVVLTGAMQPARMAQTDAVFNLGFAWGVMQTLGPGVYIAMNGRVFEAGHVRKNRDAGRFETV
ncbi:MAG: asparaginase domain-containing protein [Phycisphaerales bacterium JB063]